MSNKADKPQTDRIKECIKILKQIREEVGIPDDNPSIRLLKKRMERYMRDGKPQEDRIPLVNSDRLILYKLPRKASSFVEVTMRVSRISYPQLPSDLVAELEEQTNSATPPDPVHPSPPASTD